MNGCSEKTRHSERARTLIYTQMLNKKCQHKSAFQPCFQTVEATYLDASCFPSAPSAYSGSKINCLCTSRSLSNSSKPLSKHPAYSLVNSWEVTRVSIFTWLKVICPSVHGKKLTKKRECSASPLHLNGSNKSKSESDPVQRHWEASHQKHCSKHVTGSPIIIVALREKHNIVICRFIHSDVFYIPIRSHVVRAEEPAQRLRVPATLSEDSDSGPRTHNGL